MQRMSESQNATDCEIAVPDNKIEFDFSNHFNWEHGISSKGDTTCHSHMVCLNIILRITGLK